MTRSSFEQLAGTASRALAAAAVAALLSGCDKLDRAPGLSKTVAEGELSVPVPPENGPTLASIADQTPVLAAPNRKAQKLGYLHAGSRVVRASEPYSKDDCAAGWYPVRPAGFVCVGDSATLDMRHPTLAAMAILPSDDQTLPYSYARTRIETTLFERDSGRDSGVKPIGALKKHAGMAVVGSWSANLPDGKPTRLALLTSGKFVKAEDLEAAQVSSFAGAELGKEAKLPLAWVVRSGVRLWKLDGTNSKKGRELEFHSRVSLTGRFRTVEREKFWATENGDWVRHKDVTVALPRSKFPDFAKDGQRWIDVSIVTGVLVAYEGRNALFATLASVARPLDDPAFAAAAPVDGSAAVIPVSVATHPSSLGTFEVRGKELTWVGANPRQAGESYELYDVPWVISLSSGKAIYGAYWHDRFGVEHGPGSIELSPSDAHRLFSWVTPALPRGFHGYSPAKVAEGMTFVVMRK